MTAAPGEGAVIPLDQHPAPGRQHRSGAPLAPVQPTAQLKRFRRKAQGASAYVKISEGCDHKCAFCIIPAIRGKHVSKPIAEIVAEVRDLTEQGVREVHLHRPGQHLLRRGPRAARRPGPIAGRRLHARCPRCAGCA